MGPRRQIGRCDPERGSKVDGGAAAEAVAAARKIVVVLMWMKRRFSVVVGLFLGARLAVSVAHMECSVGVAANECERQDQNQAAEKQ